MNEKIKAIVSAYADMEHEERVFVRGALAGIDSMVMPRAKPGRPKGSPNKPKAEDAPLLDATNAAEADGI